MPRVSEVIDDATPMAAARIDIGARIGWLLRVSRSAAGMSLREMSAALEAHDVSLAPTTLSRIESEGQRSPAALDGYASVLGLPQGALRSAVDNLCRTFSYAPSVLPDPVPGSLERFSAAYEAVTERAPTAGAWVTFALEHAGIGGFGLPRTLMEPQLRRLADELGRSFGRTRATRYEAMALLRCSAYGELVEEVLRELLLDPDTQRVYDLTSVLSEQPTTALLAWFGDLLRHESILVTRGASYALQNMLVVGGLGAATWASLVPAYVRAWREAHDDPDRRAVLHQLCGALPPRVQAGIKDACDLPRETGTGPRVWTRSRDNAHYEFARSIALEACARVGHRDEPLLARLLFEAMFDPRGARMVSSSILVASSPFCGPVVQLLVERRHEGPDDASRLAAMRVAGFCHQGEELPRVATWLTSRDPAEFEFALGTHARTGTRLPQESLERGLAGDELLVNRTLYAAGMATDPRLRDLARRTDVSDQVRRGARWWAAREGRVLD